VSIYSLPPSSLRLLPAPRAHAGWPARGQRPAV